MKNCPFCKGTGKIEEDIKSMPFVEFVNYLKKNDAYQGIDIDREVGKAKAWLQLHPDRKLTMRFIMKWLSRCEPVLKQEEKRREKPPILEMKPLTEEEIEKNKASLSGLMESFKLRGI